MTMMCDCVHPVILASSSASTFWCWLKRRFWGRTCEVMDIIGQKLNSFFNVNRFVIMVGDEVNKRSPFTTPLTDGTRLFLMWHLWLGTDKQKRKIWAEKTIKEYAWDKHLSHAPQGCVISGIESQSNDCQIHRSHKNSSDALRLEK